MSRLPFNRYFNRGVVLHEIAGLRAISSVVKRVILVHLCLLNVARGWNRDLIDNLGVFELSFPSNEIVLLRWHDWSR